MSVVRVVLPIAIVIFAGLLAALPWGLASAPQSTLPMLVAALVYLWNVRRPGAVPHVAAFVVGIGLDAVGQGPLGHWPLVFLAASACAALARDLFRTLDSRHVLVSASAYLAAMSVLIAFAWSFQSLFDFTPADTGGLLAALAVSVVTYPLLGSLVAGLEAATASDGDARAMRAR